MPQHKSCAKRVITNQKRAVANRHAISVIRTLTKKMDAATSVEEGKDVLRELTSRLDKADQKSRLHRNQVARRKSRAQRQFNKLEG